MADFQHHIQSLRPCQAFSELGMNMEMLKQLAELTPNFSVATPLAHHHGEFPAGFSYDNSLYNYQTDSLMAVPNVQAIKGKEVGDQSTSINSKNITSSSSTSEFKGESYKSKKNRSRKGKKVSSDEKEEGKSEEIIHVRAKRGQATDSHSLAERVRREKINKKMRCLQDLVPGCHKAMGMAGMLEEIINYVHSLQNQVEFLSMELAAACSSNGLSFERESSKKAQGTNSHEAMEMEKWAKEVYGDHASFHSIWSL